jgi:hypothetical protein
MAMVIPVARQLPFLTHTMLCMIATTTTTVLFACRGRRIHRRMKWFAIITENEWFQHSITANQH